MEKKLVYHDISLTLTEGMITYPKDVAYRRYLQRDMSRGDSSNVSAIETSVHVGTHVDAPRHYFPAAYGAEGIGLERLYGPARVVDCRGLTAVTAEDLKDALPPGTERILLKTDNSARLHAHPEGPFEANFIYLEASGARLLVERKVMLVAIDYLSIDKAGLREKPAHHLLLKNHIVIVEGVDLALVEEGEYFLACGCLKMAGADGAPCRAVLLENLL